MNKSSNIENDKVLERIKQEKRIDKWLLRFAFSAWFFTILLFAIYSVLVISKMNGIHSEYTHRVISIAVEVATISLSFFAMGFTSLCISIVSTLGVFFRTRTTSLKEIQVRLNLLQQSLFEEKDS